jgi:hypothetical protein
VSNGVHTPSADLTAANATITGDLTVSGTTITIDSATAQTVDLGDNDKIRLGDSDDAQVYHDGSDLIINNDTGDIAITGANVGIGTSSPNAQLTIANANDSVVLIESTGSESTDDARLEIKTTNGTFTIQNDRSIGTSGALTFAGNTSNNLIIDHNTGNVGIGTTTMDAFLNVNSGTGNATLHLESTDTSCNLTQADNSGSTNIASNGGNLIIITGGSGGTAGVGGSEAMRIDSLGHVTIGRTSRDNATTDNGHNLYASGEHYLYTSTTNTNNDVIRVHNYLGNVTFSVDADGDVQNTNNSYTAISDQSIKENIVDANSQWDDIKALQIRNYNLINYPNKTHLGVVAQEVEAVGMNGLIKENEDGLKSVKYSILYMKAVKALQEAIGRIETLEAEVATLKEAN